MPTTISSRYNYDSDSQNYEELDEKMLVQTPVAEQQHEQAQQTQSQQTQEEDEEEDNYYYYVNTIIAKEINLINRITDENSVTKHEDGHTSVDNPTPYLSNVLCKNHDDYKVAHNFYTFGLQFDFKYDEDNDTNVPKYQFQRRFCAKCGNYRRLPEDDDDKKECTKIQCQCYGQDDIDVGLCVFDYFYKKHKLETELEAEADLEAKQQAEQEQYDKEYNCDMSCYEKSEKEKHVDYMYNEIYERSIDPEPCEFSSDENDEDW